MTIIVFYLIKFKKIIALSIFEFKLIAQKFFSSFIIKSLIEKDQ